MDGPRIAEANLLAEEPYNAADRKQVNERNIKIGRELRAKLEYTKLVMSTPEGRKWMMDLLKNCAPFDDPEVPGDVYRTYKKMGRQDIGRKLFNDIEAAAPDEFFTMMKEAKE